MYYIIEHGIRPNGVVNTSETARSTFSSALSFYYERMSKMVASEDFVSAHFMLVEENLSIIKKDDVETAYKGIPSEE